MTLRPTYSASDLGAVSLAAVVVTAWATAAGDSFSLRSLFVCEAAFLSFYLVGSLFAAWTALGGRRPLRSAAALADGLRRRQYGSARPGLAVAARHPRQLRCRACRRGRAVPRGETGPATARRFGRSSGQSPCRWPRPRCGAETRSTRSRSKRTSSASSPGSTASITRFTFESSARRTGRPPSRTSGWRACLRAFTTMART